MNDTDNSVSNFQDALNHHQNGDLINAEISYTKAIQQQDNAPTAYNNLGLIYFGKGDIQRAIGSWDAANKLSPEYLDPIINLGVSKAQLQLFPEALTHLNTAYRIDPNNQQTIFHLAQIHAQMGGVEKAYELIAPLLKTQPINPNAFMVAASIQSTIK